MISGVFLGCDRQSILYLDAISLIIVFYANRRHSHCADHRQRDDAHIGILHQPDGLDGVVQGVSEQGIKIRLFHMVQPLTIRYTIQTDFFLLTQQSLFRQQQVQHIIARIYPGIIYVDQFPNAVDFPLGTVILLGRNQPQQMTHVMAFQVEHPYRFLRQRQLLALLVPHFLNHGRFMLHLIHFKNIVENHQRADASCHIIQIHDHLLNCAEPLFIRPPKRGQHHCANQDHTADRQDFPIRHILDRISVDPARER